MYMKYMRIHAYTHMCVYITANTSPCNKCPSCPQKLPKIIFPSISESKIGYFLSSHILVKRAFLSALIPFPNRSCSCLASLCRLCSLSSMLMGGSGPTNR